MAEYGSRPFAEQVAFFQGKVSLPTRTFRDVQAAANARAFVVAGAMRDDLLADFRQVIGKAIESGTTLEEFRKDFDAIVERRGWTGWTGEGSEAGRAWRTRTIYQTNLRTSYHAGRYKQMKAAAEARPYWRYRHSFASENPRVNHQSWDGLVLRHDDPWWDIHYPPNGWGCGCFVETLAERDLARMGKDGPDEPPTAPDSRVGVGEGWDYSVGEAAWGRPISERAWSQANDRAWQPLITDTWQDLGLPEKLPADSVPVALGPRLNSAADAVAGVRAAIGGQPERVFSVDAGRFRYPLLVNAETLGPRLAGDKSRFLPLLESALEDPAEVWASFERSPETGLVALRVRLLKLLQAEDGPAVMAVFEAISGQLVGVDFAPAEAGVVNSLRTGRILHQRQ